MNRPGAALTAPSPSCHRKVWQPIGSFTTGRPRACSTASRKSATAPFVWFSDFAVLAFLQAVAVSKLLANHEPARGAGALTGGVLFHVFAQRLEQAGTPYFGLAEMFWFPAVLLAIYMIAVRPVRTQFSPDGDRRRL